MGGKSSGFGVRFEQGKPDFLSIGLSIRWSLLKTPSFYIIECPTDSSVPSKAGAEKLDNPAWPKANQ